MSQDLLTVKTHLQHWCLENQIYRLTSFSQYDKSSYAINAAYRFGTKSGDLVLDRWLDNCERDKFSAFISINPISVYGKGFDVEFNAEIAQGAFVDIDGKTSYWCLEVCQKKGMNYFSIGNSGGGGSHVWFLYKNPIIFSDLPDWKVQRCRNRGWRQVWLDDRGRAIKRGKWTDGPEPTLTPQQIEAQEIAYGLSREFGDVDQTYNLNWKGRVPGTYNYKKHRREVIS